MTDAATPATRPNLLARPAAPAAWGEFVAVSGPRVFRSRAAARLPRADAEDRVRLVPFFVAPGVSIGVAEAPR